LYRAEEFLHEKKKLGKTLLVFPSHSINGLYSVFNINEFIDEILQRSKSFDTTIICLYFHDIQKNNYLENYKKAGFRIVTAGHIHDFHFLSRLKHIISLSDFTMSNSVGTHIGYCIYLKKPHLLFNQKLTYKHTYNKHIGEFRNKKQSSDLLKETEMIRNAFIKESHTITNNQFKVAKHFWGFNQIKKSSELNGLLKSI
jgi:hypothetical protein